VNDLRKQGDLLVIEEEVDPNLEMAEIHRRVYDAKGPAILFRKVKGSPFEAVSNIYGTNDRAEFLFRDTLEKVQRVVELKADPGRFIKNPFAYLSAPFTALKALPLRSKLFATNFLETKIDQLPQIKSWPDDGGAFITLPQVFSLPPGERSLMQSNVGMYRIQLSGNDYLQNEEIGLHYQLHRGIGIHHKLYNETSDSFKVSIFIGGPPSHALSAIFPLPEGLSELTFAGMMANRRFRYHWRNGYVISNDADFVITGTILKDKMKPEGPFGDHLGYYSLQHDFPVMKVDKVFHRKDPLWHFTVVGRPPQEDSGFGHLIHKIVGPLLPSEFPGVREIHAVDVAGVHPLLLSVGSERYMPFRQNRPEEILIQANRLLGSGQTSLAKYLIIAADEPERKWSAYQIPTFFDHVLSCIDWSRDLHFQTRTTIDTLDYSGGGWNEGSKVVWATCGAPIRKLANVLPGALSFPETVKSARLIQSGIVALEYQPFRTYEKAGEELEELTTALRHLDLSGFPLLILVDDADFASVDFDNFLWVTFTRSNPSHDIYGVDSFFDQKHWGCHGPLIIDARIKPHHAPELFKDERVSARVDDIMSRTRF